MARERLGDAFVRIAFLVTHSAVRSSELLVFTDSGATHPSVPADQIGFPEREPYVLHGENSH